MATKGKHTPATKERHAKVVSQLENQDHAKLITDLANAPAMAGATAAIGFLTPVYGKERIDVVALADSLAESISKVQAGSMEPCEKMLLGQAQALQGIFSGLAYRAASCAQLQHYDRFLSLALKAQAQCRATLQTLAEMKNPPVVWARNANVVNGQQQVNVGNQPPAQAAQSPVVQNELLEGQHGQRMDGRSEDKAGGSDSALEAMAAVNGTAHRRG